MYAESGVNGFLKFSKQKEAILIMTSF